MKMATLGWRTFPNGACTGRCTALDSCVHALYIHERHSNIFVCTDYVCKQVRPTMRPCVQKVKDGRAQIAALKEQISVQNKASHIEETYTSRQLTCWQRVQHTAAATAATRSAARAGKVEQNGCSGGACACRGEHTSGQAAS